MSKLLIVGGGIGGLAAALALADHHHEVLVLERNPVFAEIGAGIQLAPNAFTALDVLGVGEAVRAQAVFLDEMRLMDALTGAPIALVDLGERFVARFGHRYAVVHRHDIHAPLLRACRDHPSIELRAGCDVVGYEQDEHGIRVVASNGERIAGTALIGADGLRSAIRAQLLGDGPPRISGHTIYRSVVRAADVPEAMRAPTVTLFAGPKYHLVHYPIAGGKLINIAATVDNGARQAVAGEPVAQARVRAAFTTLANAPRTLLDCGRDWKSWVLCDRDPTGIWTDGRVALLGDAAHPMLQYAAQGAAMALEDAVALRHLLDIEPVGVAELFRRYNAVRFRRTARIQDISRFMGEAIYHPSASRADERTRRIAALGTEGLYDAVDWLYRYSGDTATRHLLAA
ncbi:MAG TPA: FAD-dependent monooxygenase [Luteibacter sp.]|nr:FAD-dependent monooxygenase [Luteibacter sp.]